MNILHRKGRKVTQWKHKSREYLALIVVIAREWMGLFFSWLSLRNFAYLAVEKK